MSAVTQNEYTGNGSTTNYSFTFPYLKASDIKASLDAVETTAFTLANATTLQFNTAPSNGAKIKIFRETGVDNLTATFYAGSAIKSEDLNDNFTQNLFVTQEVNQRYLSTLGGTMTGNLNLGKDADLVYEGATNNDFETRFTVVDPTADRTITFPNVTGTVITTGDTGTVTGAMLADSTITSGDIVDGTIVNADINASADIAGTKLADDSVTLAKLGSGALPTDITIASANIVNGTIISEDIATDAVVTDKIMGSAVTTGKIAGAAVTNSKIANDAVTTDKIGDNSISTALIQDDAVTIGKIADAAIVTNSEQASHSVDDATFFTTAAAEARYFNASTGETIKDGQTFPDNDTTIATTAAINDRIIDLVDDVGGFVPIANETSFPNANPDVNNGAGTLVSIQALSQNLTSNGSGQISISNGTVGNSTVTITNAGANKTFTSGFGIIVETTSTLNTYAFHRYVPQATEITTVAGSIGNVNTVAGSIANVNSVGTNIANVNSVAGNATNINSAVSNASNINSAVSNASNITTVAGISGNVTTVAGISSDVTTVANDGSDIGTVSTNIANVNNVGGSIANVNTVAGSIANVNTVAGNNSNVTTVAGISGNVTTVAGISGNVTTVAGNNSNVSTVAGSIANVNTTAGSIANVNTTASSIANVNTVATNITNVNNASTYLNNFLALYLGEAASAPSTDTFGNALTEGDFYFNTVNKQLQVFNGSVFTSIFAFAFDIEKAATAAFNALYTAAVGQNSINLGGLAITGAVFGDEKISTNRISLTKGSATYNLGGI